MKNTDYRKALNSEESLAIFLGKMALFDREFCDAMAAGDDFTLKLEIHGNKGEMNHSRVTSDRFERPSGVERKINQKVSRKHHN